jgi:hypothetical protein
MSKALTAPGISYTEREKIRETKNTSDADTTIAGPVGKSQLSDE